MASPLRPLGFDLPAAPNVQPQVQQQLPQGDTAGLQILSAASQRFDQTLQLDTQTAQQSAQVVAQLGQASVNTAQAISQTAAQEAQSKANRSQQNAQAIGNLGESVMRVTAQYAERKGQEAARIQEQQDAMATRAIADLQVDWIEKGLIDQQGTQAYRDTIAETLGRFSLAPKSIASLTERAYAPALDYAKRTEDNRQDALRKADEQRKRVYNAELQNKLSASLAALEAKGYVDPAQTDEAIANVKLNVKLVMGDENVPLGDRLFAVANALESTNERLLGRNVRNIELNSMVEGVRTLRQMEAELLPQVRAGTLPRSVYRARIEMAALERGIQSFDVTDPNEDAKAVRDTLETTGAIKKIQQEQYLEGVSAVEVDDATVGALVTQFELSPSAAASARTAKDIEYDRNGKEAVRVFGEWETFKQKETPQFNIEYQRKITQNKVLQSEFEEWYVNARRDAERGQSVPSPTRQLEALRGFDPQLAAQMQGKPLTQADVNTIYQAYERRAQANNDEARVMQQNYNNRLQYFRRYGLSLNVEETRAANKKQQGALQQYRQRMEEAKLQKLQTPAYPGAQPNFNGAALPRKPLAWGDYGGKKITYPFPVNVAAQIRRNGLEPGQEFGASRSGGARQHQGLDFAVATGTETLAMVPGRVVKVTGDTPGYGISVEIEGADGHRYFYAHLSKALVREGQQLSGAEVIALTGNTQGGRGQSTGPHLHLEVRDPNGRFLNPLEHLASRDFSKAPQPRTSGAVRPANSAPSLPAGAVPMGRNSYLLNGKVIKVNYDITGAASTTSQPAQYSTANPVRNSYAGAKRTPGRDDDDNNHSYSVLANDRQFTRGLNQLARKYNIPGEWLADVMAHETGNTFDPGEPNGVGHYGLIQFGAPARADLGVTVDQLRRMTRTQQLVYVDRYLALQMQYAGLKNIRNPAELAALVFMGGQGAADLRRTGRVGSELSGYLQQMGRFGGRQYDSQGNRRNRASNVIHERPAVACSVCASMADAQAFFPHEGQRLSEYIA